tara:strand:- start:317 stop:2077 length:1761 start_codon:yes stop_codon:yes gene_type:complete
MEIFDSYINNLFEHDKRKTLSCVTEYEEGFKLPIYYNDSKKELNESIFEDLELLESHDSSNCLYDCVFDNKSELSKKMMKPWSKYYTTDKVFLKESQKFYSKMEIEQTNDFEKTEKIIKNYITIYNNPSFRGHYDFVEIKYFDFLNYSGPVLQMLSMYNLLSPLQALILPLCILIVPFFVLKLKGYDITIKGYIDILTNLLNNALIGKIFRLHTMNYKDAAYTLFSLIVYIYQFYCNVKFCYRYYSNLYEINNNLVAIRSMNEITIKNMKTVLMQTQMLDTYEPFNKVLTKNLNKLVVFNEELESISKMEFNVKRCFDIGYAMKMYFNLFQNKEYIDAMIYSFGFNGFVLNIIDIHANIRNKYINKATFTKKTLLFKNAYYAPLKKKKGVKNTYNLKKNTIITGPNASGKTTLLKCTLFNLILSQQIGYGFYDKAKIKLFDNFHCYLNIPDTSGRDSLFQAEARRCKNILEVIEKEKDKNHFCIFDEIYSGTNPHEATASAYAYLKYLLGYSNFNFMITTHYFSVCDYLNKDMKNIHMHVLSNDYNLTYTYLVKNGISSVKGGLKVLHDLDYPSEIIEYAEEKLKQ